MTLRLLQHLNLAGVLALAVLCGFQWQANRRSELHGIRMDAVRMELASRVGDLQRLLTNSVSDVEVFRNQITGSNTEIRELKQQLETSERRKDHLELESVQLRSSLSNWMAAVAIRDERIRDSTDRLNRLASGQREAVAKINELVGQYNDVTRLLNERTQMLKETTERTNKAGQKPSSPLP